MDILKEITSRVIPLLQVGPEARYGGLHDRFSAPMSHAWLWGGAILLVAAAAISAALAYRRQAAGRKAWRAFDRQADELGLSPEERSLLARITRHARRAGLGGLAAIFTSEAFFQRGLEAMTAKSVPGGGDKSLCGGCPFLALLQEKLGFQIQAGQAKATAIQLGPVTVGSVITVIRPIGSQTLEAVVAGMKGSEELTIALPAATDCRPGETWVLRLPQGGTVWEFDAMVLRVAGRNVVVRPVGEMRWINRRRFVRVPVRRPAYVADFPFRSSQRDDQTPNFCPAALVEIGGPGLQLVAPLQTRPGRRLLVIVELADGKVIEGVGVVHRAVASEDGTQISVEMIGLNTTEISELAKATNEAAKAKGLATAPGRAAPVAVAVAQES